MRFRPVVAAALCLSLVAAACGDGKDEGVSAQRSDSTPSGSTQSTDAGGSPTSDSSSTPTTEAGDPGLPPITDPATTDTAAPETPAPGQEFFNWQDFGGDSTVQTGSLQVPIDYNDPSQGTFDLYVARHAAADPSQRIGSLLVNPGGPGFGGSDFAVYADQIYSQKLLDHFDIIGWDPRGTGLSEPAIDCIDDYDKYFAYTDITPDDNEERQQIIDLAEEFQNDCASKNADILQYIGTNNSAHDMDSIRQSLGEDTITYFGFSYGSELGATWATLFPDTVRAAVLDGAADPDADFLESGLQQTKGFEASVDTFLSRCSDNADCAFYNDGKAEDAFDALMQALDDKPIPTETGRPDLTRSVALSGVIQAMYTESLWPQLEQALGDAQGGDGSGLLALYDQYYQRQPDGTYDNSLEAFQTISCMDEPERLTVEEDDATAAEYTAVAPRIAPGTTGSYFCTFYPAAQDPRVEITGKGAGPILVVGTTGDPATPLSSTENMAKKLENGVLVVVVADQHTGYGVNQCSYDTIDDYLIDVTVPEDGIRCE
jgi:pimeloyl-ACP methyl ester carboxylesterase